MRSWNFKFGRYIMSVMHYCPVDFFSCQCTNPSVIVRLHDQGASKNILASNCRHSCIYSAVATPHMIHPWSRMLSLACYWLWVKRAALTRGGQ